MYPPRRLFCAKNLYRYVCVSSQKKELLSRSKERSNWRTKRENIIIIIIIIIFRVTNGLGFWRETRERRERRALFRRRRRGEINNNVGARGNVERGPRDRRVRERKPESLAELSQTLRAEVLQRCKILLRATRFRGAKRGSDEYGARRGVDMLHVPLQRGGEGRRRGKPKKFFADEIVKTLEKDQEELYALKHDQIGTVSCRFFGRRYQPIAVFNHDERFRPRFRWETYHFGRVVEGLDVLQRINEAYCDENGRPWQNIRITSCWDRNCFRPQEYNDRKCRTKVLK